MINKKTVMLVLTAVTLFAAVPTAAAEEAKDTKETVEIQILSTSDIHGKMLPYDYALDAEDTSGSLAQISTLVKELRTENTIVLDNGDLIQGNSADLFLDDEIHPMILGLNAVGYDIWVPGNHEFNYGVDTLK
ncbi:MAG: metallophosphoesterase [Clostridia bacterium]|nr:metallophosphoesterase [Clostridia bacterium]MDY5555064.1 metallophosphoesterase [Blautia sp.]